MERERGRERERERWREPEREGVERRAGRQERGGGVQNREKTRLIAMRSQLIVLGLLWCCTFCS